MVEIGEITRFLTPAELAHYANLACFSRQSGTSMNGPVPSQRGNHRQNAAAFASLRHPPSRAHHDRKRREGTRHN